MNARIATLSFVLVLAVACSDDKNGRQSNGLTTSPGNPRLTMKTVPANASTVCVASVRKRDEVLAKNPKADHAALDAVIEDVCE